MMLILFWVLISRGKGTCFQRFIKDLVSKFKDVFRMKLFNYIDRRDPSKPTTK
jgi:hypothetical protein